MKYRQKPVVIEAVQWLPDDPEATQAMVNWLGTNGGTFRIIPGAGPLLISTPDGQMRTKPGDWVIKGVRGEFYPCNASIFEETYEQVSDD